MPKRHDANIPNVNHEALHEALTEALGDKFLALDQRPNGGTLTITKSEAVSEMVKVMGQRPKTEEVVRPDGLTVRQFVTEVVNLDGKLTEHIVMEDVEEWVNQVKVVHTNETKQVGTATVHVTVYLADHATDADLQTVQQMVAAHDHTKPSKAELKRQQAAADKAKLKALLAASEADPQALGQYTPAQLLSMTLSAIREHLG